MEWLWYFVFYSFLGYLLEKMYAKVTRARQQVRKCLLFLPLCPVYGLAMVLFLALTDAEQYSGWALVLRGGILCTLAEYAVHLFYDQVFHVRFWDYSGVPGNVWGRVCLPFSLVWSALSAWAAVFLQPVLEQLAAAIPPGATLALLLILSADIVFSCAILLRYHDTELLSLGAVARRLEQL